MNTKERMTMRNLAEFDDLNSASFGQIGLQDVHLDFCRKRLVLTRENNIPFLEHSLKALRLRFEKKAIEKLVNRK